MCLCVHYFLSVWGGARGQKDRTAENKKKQALEDKKEVAEENRDNGKHWQRVEGGDQKPCIRNRF